MNLKDFLYCLHFDIDRIQSPNGEVDGDDIPLPYKLYRGLPAFPLSSEVPLALEKGAPLKPDLRGLGHFLWFTSGLQQCCQSAGVWDSAEAAPERVQCRRYIPSGGALYPNECYVYLKLEELPSGVYHYDPAHHRLVLLRKGDFDSFLSRALGRRCEMSSCFGAVFLSTMFWKNAFKYGNFAYRLQGLDTGVLIGQFLEVAERSGIQAGVCFQFLDRAVNRLLGLSETEESVYAVIPLSREPIGLGEGSGRDGPFSETELCGELEPLAYHHHVRSGRVRELPMLIRMNGASMQESTAAFRQVGEEKRIPPESKGIPLPRVNRPVRDLGEVCRKRVSPGTDFVLGKVSQRQLATLLREATASFHCRNDLDGNVEKVGSRLTLRVSLYGVENIPDGAYEYDGTAHALLPVRPGDHRARLQQGMSLHNVNLFQVPLCFHVTGARDHLTGELGFRGYRIQQMEAGMLLQRLLLAATALGLGGHPLLGFDGHLCDDLYRLTPQNQTTLIQIPVGPHRPRPVLQGSLHG
ncbi:SagB-type dehydrogenase family enzyme [Melghirimyces profundicolus]|uniref:SagB-type dehydrogenase family enzyme n=1 Tax=Melghirimyces profundicolus TaxID=1242148 RepID=A0A2T6C8T7_9BACL|nr:SagB family peptide dehydrogenase [Melghirimyces profundicolus]PTX64709.1 SagB-type dehydrogenase family enzyme [Melghirimyces profundicolus]